MIEQGDGIQIGITRADHRRIWIDLPYVEEMNGRLSPRKADQSRCADDPHGDPDLDAVALLDHGGTAPGSHAPPMHRICDAPYQSDHWERIRSFVVTVEQPLDWTAFGVWLTMLINRHGDKVLRVKGILNLVGKGAGGNPWCAVYWSHNPSYDCLAEQDGGRHIVYSSSTELIRTWSGDR